MIPNWLHQLLTALWISIESSTKTFWETIIEKFASWIFVAISGSNWKTQSWCWLALKRHSALQFRVLGWQVDFIWLDAQKQENRCTNKQRYKENVNCFLHGLVASKSKQRFQNPSACYSIWKSQVWQQKGLQPVMQNGTALCNKKRIAITSRERYMYKTLLTVACIQRLCNLWWKEIDRNRQMYYPMDRERAERSRNTQSKGTPVSPTYDTDAR
jgi:hypothetical protein